MGGAQPLAVAMLGGVCLIADVDYDRLRRRYETRYLDVVAPDLDSALREVEEARAQGEGRSVGVVGDASQVFEAVRARGVQPDVVTDQTSAHDPLGGYIPTGMALEDAADVRARDPEGYVHAARTSMARHCAAMVEFQDDGAVVFDYGNNLRTEALAGGFERAFSYPGFVPAYVRPLFCRGVGPFRWVALSGEPHDIAATDAAMRELFPENVRLQRWLDQAGQRIAFQGLPARICWIGYGDRHRAGLRFNELVRSGEVAAPIVIGRDHLDSGSVASPYRETEAMQDGSDAIADWPILNAMLNVASGAAWVAVHHGGGVGIGRSIHSGAQVVADGTDDGAFRLERVLTNDPGTGVMRHAHAGYAEALEHARATGLDLAGLDA
jgi:urocanate hydratase